jgi:DNA mismatch repair protein MutS
VFATHFHELTRLARPGRGFLNLNVVVREWEDRVIFLRRVEEGAADRSYGIHVAQLAGVPETVVERARGILARLESESRRIAPAADDARREGGELEGRPTNAAPRPPDPQLHLFAAPEPPFLEELRRLDPDRLTPLAALALLARWRRQLDGPDGD